MKCAALVLLAAACAAPVSDPRASQHHEAAVAIAQWLEATATGPSPRDPSLYAGVSGEVLFFLALRQLERDGAMQSRWLALALRGADELVATLPAKCQGEGCGLYTGVAGVGFTLAEVFEATGDVKYRDGARRCVELLHASAQLAGSGIEWSATTDVIAGSAGIGCFLLDLHDREAASGDADRFGALALDLATRAGRRLLDLSQREAVGRSWRMDPAFPRVMPNFSHGTAGVAWFLARLHETTKVPEFLAAARDGADHLLAIADTTDAGCRIHHHTPDGTDLYYLGWCHGPCGTARLFELLDDLDGDPTGETKYRDAARGCVRSVMTSGLPEQRLPGFWNNVGVCCGSAGVIEFMLERARATGDADCARFAERVADDLLQRGTRDAQGLRFVHAEHRVKPELLEAQRGFMQGAAGIGFALLDLEAFERGMALDLVLPDAR